MLGVACWAEAAILKMSTTAPSGMMMHYNTERLQVIFSGFLRENFGSY